MSDNQGLTRSRSMGRLSRISYRSDFLCCAKTALYTSQATTFRENGAGSTPTLPVLNGTITSTSDASGRITVSGVRSRSHGPAEKRRSQQQTRASKCTLALRFLRDFKEALLRGKEVMILGNPTGRTSIMHTLASLSHSLLVEILCARVTLLLIDGRRHNPLVCDTHSRWEIFRMRKSA